MNWLNHIKLATTLIFNLLMMMTQEIDRQIDNLHIIYHETFKNFPSFNLEKPSLLYTPTHKKDLLASQLHLLASRLHGLNENCDAHFWFFSMCSNGSCTGVKALGHTVLLNSGSIQFCLTQALILIESSPSGFTYCILSLYWESYLKNLAQFNQCVNEIAKPVIGFKVYALVKSLLVHISAKIKESIMRWQSQIELVQDQICSARGCMDHQLKQLLKT